MRKGHGFGSQDNGKLKVQTPGILTKDLSSNPKAFRLITSNNL